MMAARTPSLCSMLALPLVLFLASGAAAASAVEQFTSSYMRQPATPDLPLLHRPGSNSQQHQQLEGRAASAPAGAWDASAPDAPVQQVHLTIGSSDGLYAAVDWATLQPAADAAAAPAHGLLTAAGCDTDSAAANGVDATAFAAAAASIQSTVIYREGDGGANLRRHGYKRASGRFSCYTSSRDEEAYYTSPLLHSAVFGPLEPGTNYYYSVGSDETGYSPEASFTTPPASEQGAFPMRLALIGDLGQTRNSEATLAHTLADRPDTVLMLGDLSYADDYQPRWDSYRRLAQPLASTVPVLVIEGNHEIEKYGSHARGLARPERFTAYLKRFTTPQGSSGTQLYYSVDVGPAHIIMLGCYTDYSTHSEQWHWLRSDLRRVDRERTPWLIVGMHAPWYNSNEAHNGEVDDMRQAMEELLYQAGVDIVFAGHVHAYERTRRVYRHRPDDCAPHYITIGDGGNREGLSGDWLHPQPEWSVFRESSYGHGAFDCVNATHARWAWHRNDDGQARQEADALWVVRDTERCPPPEALLVEEGEGVAGEGKGADAVMAEGLSEGAGQGRGEGSFQDSTQLSGGQRVKGLWDWRAWARRAAAGRAAALLAQR